MMDMEYWCPKEKKVVLTRFDIFNHLHLGMKSCYVCRECGAMVTLREGVKKDAL